MQKGIQHVRIAWLRSSFLPCDMRFKKFFLDVDEKVVCGDSQSDDTVRLQAEMGNQKYECEDAKNYRKNDVIFTILNP
ncbi:MAG TPA: hypothetical protein VGJ00_08445 [Rhabdochlamydiaceae bacterium]